MSGTVQGVLPFPLPKAAASLASSRPASLSVPSLALSGRRVAKLPAAVSAIVTLPPPASRSGSSITIPPPAPRATAASIASFKAHADRVPFPVLFVAGAIFGVLFALGLVSFMHPRAAVAPVTAVAPPPVQVAAARVETAPFVAWAAPPTMPTVAAAPEVHPAPPAVPVAHRNAKHAKNVRRGR